MFCAATAAAQAPSRTEPAPPPPARTNQATRNPALPEAPYVPLSTRQKLNTFLRQTYSPYTFMSAGLSGLLDQASGTPREYGGGLKGYGRRAGASLANTEASRFFNRFLFPTVFSQDPRYFPARANMEVGNRAVYAISRVLITRGDSGKNEFNYSEVLGDLFTASLENTYYPQTQVGFGDTMDRFSSALISTVTSNLTREFWPDVKRLFHRHAPANVQQMEEKIEKKLPPPLRPGLPQ